MNSLLKRTVWCDRGWMPFYYGFCPSETAWRYDMKRFQCESEAYPTAPGRCTMFTKDGKLSCLVTISEAIDGCQPSGVIGVIAHEAMHVWQALMEKIGETKPSDEWGAYSYQAIFQELLEAYVSTRNPTMLRAKPRTKRKKSL